MLNGGSDNDVLAFDPADLPGTAIPVYDGGAGSDTLRFDGSGQTLDLTALSQTKIQNVEIIDLTGTGNNTLMLADVLDISSTTNTLRIDGNAGDTVDTTDAGWVAGTQVVIAPIPTTATLS